MYIHCQACFVTPKSCIRLQEAHAELSPTWDGRDPNQSLRSGLHRALLQSQRRHSTLGSLSPMESSPGREISRRLRHSSTRHSGGSGRCPRLPIDSPPLRSVQDDRRPLCARAFRLPETDVRQGPSLEVTLSPCLSRAPCRSSRLCCPASSHLPSAGTLFATRCGPSVAWSARPVSAVWALPHLARPPESAGMPAAPCRACRREPAPLRLPPAVCLGSPPVCERATFTLTPEVSPWPLT